jgi:hypothetical protein
MVSARYGERSAETDSWTAMRDALNRYFNSVNRLQIRDGKDGTMSIGETRESQPYIFLCWPERLLLEASPNIFAMHPHPTSKHA